MFNKNNKINISEIFGKVCFFNIVDYFNSILDLYF